MASANKTPDTGKDLLTSCVHCGLCLEVCPTYQLTGDENNSPRGRLRLWREESDGRLETDPWTAKYTEDCVGCLACESACPANVPYGELLEHTRHQHVHHGRTRPSFMLKAAAAVASRPKLFNLLATPIRMVRQAGHAVHSMVFPGQPAVLQSTAQYAARLMQERRPTGPRVALLTGCLMEAVFREINFATVRVLVDNNIQVIVPASQGCCGAMQEHLGLDGVDALRRNNHSAFGTLDVDAIVTNSSGCGLALRKAMQTDGKEPVPVVKDVLDFLSHLPLKQKSPRRTDARVYVDLPCHLVHGQKSPGIAKSVLDATGYQWQLAPNAKDCCGSGGVYNLQQPELSGQILKSKSAFLNDAEGSPVILATSNHVCMMQWYSARTSGLVTRPFEVRHVIQLLDPEGRSN